LDLNNELIVLKAGKAKEVSDLDREARFCKEQLKEKERNLEIVKE
jgi:hypothetical protein